MIDEKYLNKKIMISILEEEFDTNISALKERIKNCDIKYTKDEIIKYLEEKLEREHSDVVKREEQREAFYDPLNDYVSPTYLKYFNAYVNNSTFRFGDGLIIEKYKFDEGTYDFYKETIKILKTKTLKLISVIENLTEKDIKEYDIDVNNDNIKYSDIVRLIKPTIYNINGLFTAEQNGNNLNTYVDIKMSKQTIHYDGIWESQLPSPNLKAKTIEEDALIDGYISLSEKQKREIIEKEEEYQKYIIKLIEKHF